MCRVSLAGQQHITDSVRLALTGQHGPTAATAPAESCRWLSHIGALLHATMRVVEALESGTAVLVHCSDGWDRTSQLCSLAQIVLDEHYRTIDGFAVRFRVAAFAAAPVRVRLRGFRGLQCASFRCALSCPWVLTPAAAHRSMRDAMGCTAQCR